MYGCKDNAIDMINRQINYGQINGTITGVKYWTKVKQEIEKL